MVRQMDRQIDWWMYVFNYVCLDRQMDGCMYVYIYVWQEGYIEKQIDGYSGKIVFVLL